MKSPQAYNCPPNKVCRLCYQKQVLATIELRAHFLSLMCGFLLPMVLYCLMPLFIGHLVGSLIYLTVTRPYIAYAVHIVSQFMVAPCSTHYVIVLRILCLSKALYSNGLHFSADSSFELKAYVDVDWGCDPIDRLSTTGYCIFSTRFSNIVEKQETNLSIPIKYQIRISSTCRHYC